MIKMFSVIAIISKLIYAFIHYEAIGTNIPIAWIYCFDSQFFRQHAASLVKGQNVQRRDEAWHQNCVLEKGGAEFQSTEKAICKSQMGQ